MNKFKFTIRKKKDMVDALKKYGILPFFVNKIDGFSIEEHTIDDLWWNGADGWKVWEWKGPIINECKH